MIFFLYDVSHTWEKLNDLYYHYPIFYYEFELSLLKILFKVKRTKMNSRILILFFCLPTIISCYFDNLHVYEKNCDVIVHYMHLCYFFDFSDNCFPWKLNDCKVIHYSANEPNCITINCPVSMKYVAKLTKKY